MANKKNKKYKQKYERTIYGDIPLIEVTLKRFDGEEYTIKTYDPNYAPPLPRGAIRGNVNLQIFGIDVPRYYYKDSYRECVECDQSFIFTAEEQKFWFETLKFNFHTQAIRCAPCRKKKRSAKSFAKQKSILLALHEQQPQDPTIMLALAEVICEYYELEKGGDLNFAISLSRKALRANSSLLECLYWEGVAQHFLEHHKKSKVLLEKFVELAHTLPKYKNLCTKAVQLFSTNLVSN